MCLQTCTPSRTRPGTPCIPGSPLNRSSFKEELLTHFLLEETSDPKMRAYIINRQIDDVRGTLYRQTMFAEFEKVIHAIEEAGGALTLEVFKGEYRKLLEAYF